MSDLEHIRQVVRAFAAEREWQGFHSPRNLAMSPTCRGTWWRWRMRPEPQTTFCSWCTWGGSTKKPATSLRHS